MKEGGGGGTGATDGVRRGAFFLEGDGKRDAPGLFPLLQEKQLHLLLRALPHGDLLVCLRLFELQLALPVDIVRSHHLHGGHSLVVRRNSGTSERPKRRCQPGLLLLRVPARPNVPLGNDSDLSFQQLDLPNPRKPINVGPGRLHDAFKRRLVVFGRPGPVCLQPNE